MPTPGPNGKVVYIFGQGMPVTRLRSAARLRNRIASRASTSKASRKSVTPAAGKSRPFSLAPVSMKRRCLVVKPIEAGLETDLIVPTDQRTYVVRLVSDPTRFVSRLAFQYPDEDRAKWAAFEARQDESKRNAEAIAEERARKRQESWRVLPMADNAVDRLYLDYKLYGR